jgi:hypothetical protein
MVQIHRCPATVSGTKSAETTEGVPLGKVQRVGQSREPGDLPYMALRRPFEGKGRQLVWADPDRSWSGFFSVGCFPVPCGLTLLLPLRRKQGKRASTPWFLPQPCLPLSCTPVPTWYCSPCLGESRERCRLFTEANTRGNVYDATIRLRHMSVHHVRESALWETSAHNARHTPSGGTCGKRSRDKDPCPLDARRGLSPCWRDRR